MEAPPSPLRLILDGAALVANWRWLAERGGAAACGAAVKADGYGLGASGVVDRLAQAGCRDFFVATWAEAAALAPWQDGLAFSVLHGVREEDMVYALTSPARPVLNTPAQVLRWRAAGGGSCDVMVDTGMNRLGLTAAEARSGLLDGLAIDTLMSHLACADEPDHPMNERQLAAFRALREAIPARRYSLANSAGICLAPKYAFGLTRPGLALYGGVPVPEGATQRARRQVAHIEAQVVQVREIAVGETVGYGATWSASRPSRIAILNLGYADGFLRAIGREFLICIGDQFFSVIGRVSMDLLAVDMTSVEAAEVIEFVDDGPKRSTRLLAPADVGEGDWLELPFDLPAVARASGLSQYELLTGLGARYQRRWL